MDMSGNAAEWVQDWYNAKAYSETPSENPIGFRPQWNHVLRGSSWWVNPSGNDLGSGETAAFESRCAARNASHSYDDPRTGFRCAK
jgi:formylglycine-generating enzyme required for sulfatase activity